ncbi:MULTISPECIES: hypothetical protein [unclassified Streptomyces]|uniref:hypothetical protein n=1 Tax=unclassified Streptomyces TaxID=2593676 RepID=UPI00074A8942|nr:MULTISPECIES: hypothetical protein [unclassified Streptomyces]KUL73924.1 hypothetical protein ADL34_18840 [Streptomyces sp. NRRL WC-3605]KUL74359.1 hypothetical protein ADL33_17850 [Streptomyces sp. NRRL WC-3604]
MTDPGPALQGMGAATWSTEDGTAFEVALEGINHVVGAYSRLIAEARAADDAERAQTLVAERAQWSARRKSLTPADRPAVDAVTAESARLLQQLRAVR